MKMEKTQLPFFVLKALLSCYFLIFVLTLPLIIPPSRQIGIKKNKHYDLCNSARKINSPFYEKRQFTTSPFLYPLRRKKNPFSSISTAILSNPSFDVNAQDKWKSNIIIINSGRSKENREKNLICANESTCKKKDRHQVELNPCYDKKETNLSKECKKNYTSDTVLDSKLSPRCANHLDQSNQPNHHSFNYHSRYGENHHTGPDSLWMNDRITSNETNRLKNLIDSDPRVQEEQKPQNNIVSGIISKFWPFGEGEKKIQKEDRKNMIIKNGHEGNESPDPDKEKKPNEENYHKKKSWVETERPNRGSDYDKETNFLLKALESGKFPSYCLVENIDENIDNFEIYMSKEKMDELNISEGFTVLLKGKKKKEMLGIAKLDKSLKKHFVIISFSMKKNLRLMHNDIIKIYPLMKVNEIRNVVLSPFNDTVGSLSRNDLKNEVINPYLKNSYKPLCVNSNIYIPYKGKKVEFKVMKIFNEQCEENDACEHQYGYLGDNSEISLDEEYLNREDYEEHTDDITYEDLGGMKKQLNKIRELIELPLKYPEIFISIGISAPKGVLMHGIPGTGKTSIAKAIANESNAYCYIINGPEIMSKHIGESEQKLRKIFKKASEKTPCIIFIDEIDSIANKRSKSNNELEKRVVSQLLTLMDGLKKNNNVLVLAATNRPNSIDPALRRFGRFDREIEIPVPDEQGRYEILLTKTKKMKLDADVNLRKIAKECHGYVGADLAQLCFEAAIQCIKEHIHFLDLEEEDFIEFMKISVDDWKGENEETQRGQGESVLNQKNSNPESIDAAITAHVGPLHAGTSTNMQTKNFLPFRDRRKEISESNVSEKKGKNFFFKSKQKRKEIVAVDTWTKAEKLTNKPGEKGSQLKENIKNKSEEKLDSKGKKIPSYILNKLTIKAKHFQHALNICNPSSLRERQVQIPTVTWDDIGGMQDVKEQLKETILYPLEYKHLYNKFNSNYNKGILLYGPPGCGKTLLAKAIANECNANFISVKGPELLTMWFGESEANVRDLFDKARAASPCIIFFDEIDSLAKERNSNNNNDASDRVINQILTEIDGINEKKTIFIIAATNRPDILDKALTRPGRLDKLIYISLPDYKSRYSIFKAILKNTPLNDDVDIHDMAKRTEGFSGADITNLCQSAVNEAIKETIHLLNLRKKSKGNSHTRTGGAVTDPHDPVPTLSKKHFDLAFKNARISIQPEDVLKYERFKEKLSLQSFE
ncbi:cell division cycle ATPase [Plasmodium gonderi]|uniref:Cell division cycle ATPase n=1 Tax=Plasmodium gonderi TaxID=77519 RepID=A0A1Y1JCL6_PLAGO|nr:cell division cycle ATPase [Plasmodium gonderi]GAW78947.1 cell division cycle ATPase [Plasmodium gonderi]